MQDQIQASNLNLLNKFQLKGARLQNLTQLEITNLSLLLDSSNEGLLVYNTTDKLSYIWNGSIFEVIASGGSATSSGTNTQSVSTSSFDGGNPSSSISGNVFKVDFGGVL